MYQFNEIQVRHFQCDISGACFGGFYDIFSQYFEPLCLVFQNFQITSDLGVFRILALEKIHIIDDRSKRCLDIMGDIRDQLCFHALVLEAVFYSCIQSLSNMVDIICHLFLFTGKFFCWNLVLEFSVSDLLQTSDDLLSSPGFFYKIIKNCTVHYNQQKKSKCWTTINRHYIKHKLQKYKDAK